MIVYRFLIPFIISILMSCTAPAQTLGPRDALSAGCSKELHDAVLALMTHLIEKPAGDPLTDRDLKLGWKGTASCGPSLKVSLKPLGQKLPPETEVTISNVSMTACFLYVLQNQNSWAFGEAHYLQSLAINGTAIQSDTRFPDCRGSDTITIVIRG